MRYEFQLSYSDRFAGLKHFTEDDEYLYRGLKVMKMKVNRSQISWHDYGLTGEKFPEERTDS